ncbi:MAG: glycosyltransferase [Ruminiclostridium sp.]
MVNVLWIGKNPKTTTTSSLMGWPVCKRLAQRGFDVSYLALDDFSPPYKIHNVKVIPTITQDMQTPYGLGSVQNMFNVIYKRVSPDVVVICLNKVKTKEILYQLEQIEFNNIIVWALTNEYLCIDNERINIVQSFDWKGKLSSYVIHACIEPIFDIGNQSENILYIDRDYERFDIAELCSRWSNSEFCGNTLFLELDYLKNSARVENLLSKADRKKVESSINLDKGVISDHVKKVVDARYFYLYSLQYIYNIGSIECLLSGLRPILYNEDIKKFDFAISEFDYLKESNFVDLKYLNDIFDENKTIEKWCELLKLYQKNNSIQECKKTGINFKGNIWGNGSMSLTSRLLACAMDSIGVDVSLENTVLKRPEECDFIKDESEKNEFEILERKRINANQYVHIRYSGPQPSESHLLEGLFDYTIGKKNIAYWSIDYSTLGGPGCPSAKLLNSVPDQVWVPSLHSKMALLNSGVMEERIRIVPNGYLDNVFTVNNMNITNKKKFVFLHVSNFKFYLRKGIDVLLESYIKAFDKKDDVELRIHSQNDAKIAEIFELISKFQSIYRHSPNIVIKNHPLSHKELSTIYNYCDCFVFPSRGESFGLPPLEAMACKKPVIVTNWGGMLDFCNSENAYLIDYDLEPVKTWLYQGWGGGLQANPKVDSLAELMVHVYNNPIERNKKAARACEDVKEWTWKKAAYRANEIIQNM